MATVEETQDQSLEGIILSGVSGRYRVVIDGEIIICSAGGRLRNRGQEPLTGDRVTVRREIDKTGMIINVLDRRNRLVRPPIANVDMIVIVASCAPPITGLYLIDTLSVIALHNGIRVVICVNKDDLCPGADLERVYSPAGFTVVCTDAVGGEGIDKLEAEIGKGVAVLAGNSGVGKSSLLNLLIPGMDLQTGEISARAGRGKHTTRHAELYPTRCGGYICDTPGFSALDITECAIDKTELSYYFPEFTDYLGKCRYADCSHTAEEDCEIAKAVKRGEIALSRYESYCAMYEQLRHVLPWQHTGGQTGTHGSTFPQNEEP